VLKIPVKFNYRKEVKQMINNIILIATASLAVIFLIIIIAQAMIYNAKIKKMNLSKKLVDTSVIIDGRINDICESGFMEGQLIVPRFVLQELQFIADSSDPMKRNKGRRGLDLLNALKKCPGVSVEIMDRDYREIRAVDEKLVAMAKDYGAKILTNDFNLNKIAEIQGVKVLNINDLSNAIKPTFLPGEAISVKVVKEGKEKEQGIAYLNDGTMIVIDGARRMINKKVDAIVTNVLQTDAGRMIFARVDAGGRDYNAEHRNDNRRDPRHDNNRRDNRR
jgi:uncharacterized protein YacL